jgi:cytochrome P450
MSLDFDPLEFDVISDDFRQNPYLYYEVFRTKAPVCRIKSFGSYWVFSRGLVKEVVSTRKDIFLKPGKDRSQDPRPFGVAAQFGDGIFFMDPPRHTEVRAMMNDAFGAAITDAGQRAAVLAAQLLDAAEPLCDLVKAFANPLTTQVFMDVMGIPWGDGARPGDGPVVDGWIRQALKAHGHMAPLLEKLAGGTATMALRAYFLALAREPGIKTSAGAPSIMAGMQRQTGCPASPSAMSPFEVMNTAVQFGLGGYLSTEFLITTGVRNLVRTGQWELLKGDRGLLDQAVEEMLRYDAPFQMADRWVAEPTTLGGVKLEKGDKVTVVYGSANRDRPSSENPDRFDIRRPINKDGNFGFGLDIHYCIGAPLARTITKAAINAMLDKCPAPTVIADDSWLADPYFRSLEKLVMKLH